jgi:hypothetical protein
MLIINIFKYNLTPNPSPQIFENQKSSPQSGQLFIGLTTKPCYALQGRSENNTTILDAFLGQKSDSFLNRSSPI